MSAESNWRRSLTAALSRLTLAVRTWAAGQRPGAFPTCEALGGRVLFAGGPVDGLTVTQLPPDNTYGATGIDFTVTFDTTKVRPVGPVGGAFAVESAVGANEVVAVTNQVGVVGTDRFVTISAVVINDRGLLNHYDSGVRRLLLQPGHFVDAAGRPIGGVEAGTLDVQIPPIETALATNPDAVRLALHATSAAADGDGGQVIGGYQNVRVKKRNADGSYSAVATTVAAVIRLRPDGLVDPAFGRMNIPGIARGPIVLGGSEVASVVVRGGLVIAATTEAGDDGVTDAVVRAFDKATGEPARQFGDGSIISLAGYSYRDPATGAWAERDARADAVALQSDGAVLVAGSLANADGSTDGFVQRVTAGGALDPSFAPNTGGRFVVDLGFDERVTNVYQGADGSITCLVQSDGKLTVCRLRGDGSPDGTFGSGGRIVLDTVRSPARDRAKLLALPDGFLVGGEMDGDMAATKFLLDGTVDEAFGKRGTLHVDFDGGTDDMDDIVRGNDGRIYFMGRTITPTTVGSAVAVTDAGGDLVAGFGRDGKAVFEVETLFVPGTTGTSAIHAGDIVRTSVIGVQTAIAAALVTALRNADFSTIRQLRSDAAAKPGPTARLVATSTVTSPDGVATFAISYSAPRGIDVATIAPSNVSVAKLGGAPLTVRSAFPMSGDGFETVTYVVAAPAGQWQPPDSGTFVIALLSEVTDTDGLPVEAAAAFGSFEVAVAGDTVTVASPGPLTATVRTDGPTAVVSGKKYKGVLRTTLTNASSETFREVVTLNLYLSSAGTAADDDDVFVRTVTKKVKIKPGQSVTLKLKLGRLNVATPGVYQPAVQVDAIGRTNDWAVGGVFDVLAPAVKRTSAAVIERKDPRDDGLPVL